jgi:hypothetical protein
MIQNTAKQQDQGLPTFERGTPGHQESPPKARKQPNQHTYRPGAHSRASALARIDYRTNEGLIVKRFRQQLMDHIGGSPNTIQAELIERSVWLKLRILLLDKKIAEQKEFTLPDGNYYLSWVGHLRRNLTALGIKPPPKSTTPRPSLDSIIAEGNSQTANTPDAEGSE